MAWVHPDQAKAEKPIGVPLNDDALAVKFQTSLQEAWQRLWKQHESRIHTNREYRMEK
jgi:hypothetical protein